MDIKGFAQFHTPSLEIDEVRNNLILTILANAEHNPASIFRAWSLGAPGACAVQNSGRPIVLGDLDRQQCCALADQVRDLDFPGIVGSGQTAVWFAERAGVLGIYFAEPIPQQIHVIRGRPRYPDADGVSRVVVATDEDLVAEWLLEFSREALPHEPEPRKNSKNVA